MADIKQIILPDGNTYNLKDTVSTWVGTQEQYDAIVNKDPNVTYYITDAPSMSGSAKELSYDGGTGSTYNEIEGIKPNVVIGGTAYGVSGTYQIPANVLSHSIIIISLRRWSYAGSVTFPKGNIAAGAYTNGITIWGNHDMYAEFSISTAGLITITAISANWSDVYIDVIGIF